MLIFDYFSTTFIDFYDEHHGFISYIWPQVGVLYNIYMIYNQHQIQSQGLSWQFQWINDKELEIIWELLRPYEWRLVGGCVRDSLINKHTLDIDINTPLLPYEIIEIFQNFNPNTIGKDHGTVMIFLPNYKIEITTLRNDIHTDGRHAVVEFTNNWEQDSNRRDFTINGLMLDIKTMTLYDYHEGITDLLRGQVRFIGDYTKRVEEDYLRILRFIRFAIRFNNDFANQLLLLIPLTNGLKKVAQERIITEINYMLHHDNWVLAINALKLLSIDTILGGTFASCNDVTSPTTFTLEERWAWVVFPHTTSLNQWPISKAIKHTLVNSGIDISIIDDLIIWKIFNNQYFNWSVNYIYNKRLNPMNNMDNWHTLKNFIENVEVNTRYKRQKSIIINEFRGEDIHKNLITYLYDLWSEYLVLNGSPMAN